MSSFEARYEISEFGSKVLDTIDTTSEATAIKTQSIQHGDRIVYAVYIAADKFARSTEVINCHTASVVFTLARSFSQNFVLEVRDCD